MIEYITNRTRPWFHSEICVYEDSSVHSWMQCRFDAIVLPITGSGGIPGYSGFRWAEYYIKEYVCALSRWVNDIGIRKEPGVILCGNHRMKSPFWHSIDVYSIPIRYSVLGKAQYRWIENGLKTLCDRLSERYRERILGNVPEIAIANLDPAEELDWSILKGIIEKTIGRLDYIHFRVYVPDKVAELERTRQGEQSVQEVRTVVVMH